MTFFKLLKYSVQSDFYKSNLCLKSHFQIECFSDYARLIHKFFNEAEFRKTSAFKASTASSSIIFHIGFEQKPFCSK